MSDLVVSLALVVLIVAILRIRGFIFNRATLVTGLSLALMLGFLFNLVTDWSNGMNDTLLMHTARNKWYLYFPFTLTGATRIDAEIVRRYNWIYVVLCGFLIVFDQWRQVRKRLTHVEAEGPVHAVRPKAKNLRQRHRSS